MAGGRDRARTGDPLLAKQVLSQLSYTPTVGLTFILKHFSRFQNSFLRRLAQRATSGRKCAWSHGFQRNLSAAERV
jgi:hypothetical protein